MSDIQISDITNSTNTKEGSGVFDVLMSSAERHVTKMLKSDRIDQTTFGQVYLGTMQAVLQQSIAYALGQEQAGLQADLTARQVDEVSEKIDLIIAQTAQAYEQVTSSEAKTVRDNILNNKEVLKTTKEITLVESQYLEIRASTVRNDALGTIQVAKTTAEKVLLDQKLVTETAQTVDPTGGVLKSQFDLSVRQKEAFEGKHLNDTLKLQLDTWATVYAVSDGDTGSLPKFMTDNNDTSLLTSLDALITKSEILMN